MTGKPNLSAESAPRDEPRLAIRVGMDVYSTYQDEYIGSVIRVWQVEDQVTTAEQRGATGRQTGAEPQQTDNPDQPHEEGQGVNPTGFLGHGQVLGEELGPVPTLGLGNSGPDQQSAQGEYGTEEGKSGARTVSFAVRPGRINRGPFTGTLLFHTAAVESVSMERVVLKVQLGRTPRDWSSRET